MVCWRELQTIVLHGRCIASGLLVIKTESHAFCNKLIIGFPQNLSSTLGVMVTGPQAEA